MYQLKQLYREHDRFVTRQFHSLHPDQGLKAPAFQVQLDSGFGGSGPSGKGGKVAILKGWNGFFWTRSQVKKQRSLEHGTSKTSCGVWWQFLVFLLKIVSLFACCPILFFQLQEEKSPAASKNIRKNLASKFHVCTNSNTSHCRWFFQYFQRTHCSRHCLPQPLTPGSTSSGWSRGWCLLLPRRFTRGAFLRKLQAISTLVGQVWSNVSNIETFLLKSHVRRGLVKHPEIDTT